MKNRTYRLAMIGFGAVGQGFVQILQRRADWIHERYSVALSLVGVATRRAGGIYNPNGLNLAALLQAAEQNDMSQLNGTKIADPQTFINQVEADVLVEVSSTDLESGEPATSYIRAAFGRGMHVVTANKGPLALHGQALLQEARAAGVQLGYEGTIMSGTPALRLGWSNLAGCELRAARGILNGTTNYILTQMESGLSYAGALQEAQRLGYAETDPTGDVEGHDAAGKAVILANMLFDANLRPTDVQRTGITAITSDEVAAAQAAGERWKLIAHVQREGDTVTASVQPMRLPTTHPLAGVGGATNAITFTTDLLGDVTLIGPGAGGVATGFALLSDILALP